MLVQPAQDVSFGRGVMHRFGNDAFKVTIVKSKISCFVFGSLGYIELPDVAVCHN